MGENKDYYSILGIERNASESDIKKAYRKMAAKYHPDKFATKSEQEKKDAEDKFKEINEANAVLSDPDKKRNYDQYGDPNGPKMGGGFDPFSDMDPFGMGGFGFRDTFRHQRVDKGEDVEVVVNLTLEEVLNGCTKEVTYKKKVACTHCNGTGNVSGKLDTCQHCHGTGMITETQQHGFTIMQSSRPCPHCHGTGKISNGPKCQVCNGKGFEYQTVTKNITVPPGVETGMAIKNTGEGSESLRNGINGDLIIVFAVYEHKVFKRNNFDLVMELELTLEEAWCGCKKEIECLDKTRINVTIPELTVNDKILRVQNKGLKIPNGMYGSLYLKIKYKTPKTISKKQKELLHEFYKN